MPPMKYWYLALGGLLVSPVAHAQATGPTLRRWDTNHNVWLGYFGDARLAGRWGLHTEFQYRRTNGLRDPMQYFYRAGVNYYLPQKVLVTLGAVYLLSLPYGDYPDAGRTFERRIYQLVSLSQSFGRLSVTHRFIQDERWLRMEGEDRYLFQNRSRYRAQLKLALTQPKIEPGTLYALASDEIFMSYGENVAANVFNQNRLYGGLGYQVSDALAVEASYLQQLVQHDDGVVFERNHTGQLSLYFTPDLRPAAQRAAD
ncbi:MAG: DUF2490 domain-containing protein [Cytophagaceae bacterium]|nr:MAG: DUF2490 domain-containing protein [Cytophagaceae bacterium]